MQRTKYKSKIPDAINQSITKNFTQVPNDLLRNPDISFKAKGLLCLLLSNKEGWYSYITSIQQMTREGVDAIRSGIAELEKFGYLLRIQYRDKRTKVKRGSFWAYTDMPGKFDIQETLETLDNERLEPYLLQKKTKVNPYMENPDVDTPNMGNLMLIIHNSKKTNYKDIKSSSSDSASPNGKIISSQFEDFWKLYPRHVDKGKAKSTWEKVCRWNNGKRPTWKEIKSAIIKQKKSERWQDIKFIPHPTTWLNQQRWLDDPNEMKVFNPNSVNLKQGHNRYQGTKQSDEPEFGANAKTVIRDEEGRMVIQ
jgi:hypothetical protein